MAACQASDATICARMAACQASNATIRARMAASRAWESRQLCPNGPIARSWWRSGPGLPDSLRLELRTRQGSPRDDATVEAHAQRLPQVGLQALGREIVERGTLPRSELKDRKSTRLNSSHQIISYAVFCLKKKTSA